MIELFIVTFILALFCGIVLGIVVWLVYEEIEYRKVMKEKK